jgi:superfamily II DNA or RNA helicase
LSEYYPNVVQCFSDNQEWKNELKDSVEFFLNNKDKSEVVIVTQNTFIGTSFRQTLSKLNNEFIFIADECHNIATEKTLELLPDVEYRLGLSATPENFYSESLTKRLFEYFNGIIYEFSLKEAIQINRLVKYFYYPIIVTLNDDEKNKYLDLTKKIVRKLGYDPDTKKGFITKDAELLLFKRSRLIYSASEKLDFLLENSKKLSKEGKLLIYCGATSKNTSEELVIEIGEVAKLLYSDLKIGRNRLFDQLRTYGILMRNNVPYQEYIEREYFTIIEVRTTQCHEVLKTMTTKKGIKFIKKLLGGNNAEKTN